MGRRSTGIYSSISVSKYLLKSPDSSSSKKAGVFNLIKFIIASLSIGIYSLMTIELSCCITFLVEIECKGTEFGEQ